MEHSRASAIGSTFVVPSYSGPMKLSKGSFDPGCLRRLPLGKELGFGLREPQIPCGTIPVGGKDEHSFSFLVMSGHTLMRRVEGQLQPGLHLQEDLRLNSSVYYRQLCN